MQALKGSTDTPQRSWLENIFQYWHRPNWCFSLTGMNPLASISMETQQNGPGDETKTTNTLFGAIFDPTIVMMLHLFL